MKRKHPACQRRWLCPVDPLDLTGLENWLTECSEQGLHFAQYVPLPLFPYWRFACGEPQTLRYRLEPVQRKGPQSPDPEQTAYYRACGWDYCGAVHSYYHVYLAQDPQTPELYDDPVSQSYALETLERRQFREALLYLLLLVLYPLLLLGIGWNLSDWPVLFALESVTALQAPQILIYLLLFLQAFQAFWQLHRLRRLLRAGLPMTHEATPGSFRRVRWRTGACAALCLLMAVLWFSYDYRWHGAPEALTAEGRAPAYFSLHELEPEQEPLRTSRASAQRTPLLRSYEVDQSMHTLTTPAGVRYTPGMTYAYYDPTFPFLASPLMDDLIYRYTQHNYFPDENRLKPLELPGFDRALLALDTDGFGQKLFLSRNGDVLYLCYYGWTDLLEHLESIENLFYTNSS